MRPTQKQSNPFINSDTNKRYYTYDYYLRRTYGGKCLKLPLDIGCTCPNIDGRCGVGGCIYCSGRGSGDFAPSAHLSVTEQLETGRKQLKTKWNTDRVIPYFQAHTNTYADIGFLRDKFCEALRFPDVVGIHIATRADCLPSDILSLLAEISEKTLLTVELGLQSASDVTARRINRGHTYAEFLSGYHALRSAVPNARICVHIINGLPNENEIDMLATVDAVAALHPDEVKIHLLHVLRGTALADKYLRGEYIPLSLDDYAAITASQIARLPPDTVIARVTGDGAADDLLAPLWSRNKIGVINMIDKLLLKNDLWQGKNFVEK